MVNPQEHIDMETLDELKEVMEDDFQILIDTFLNDSDLRLISIRTAIESGSALDLRSAAHSFKGSSGNIGAPELSSILKILEEMGRDENITNASEVLTRVEVEYELVKESLASYR